MSESGTELSKNLRRQRFSGFSFAGIAPSAYYFSAGFIVLDHRPNFIRIFWTLISLHYCNCFWSYSILNSFGRIYYSSYSAFGKAIEVHLGARVCGPLNTTLTNQFIKRFFRGEVLHHLRNHDRHNNHSSDFSRGFRYYLNIS